ncbi:hypothetical protein BDV95DRAFT_579859 [Massariosphaeria phaeospora]|uniref:Aminoglycoside phosphotransferase domain-containing protein n=1 Tax=Massariosphaeria phaeospora TaxID=100035 RepID=A0A7C8M5Q2_9PLEO|nr:hypothetical protein BDV95DRAFT_579859 [Massariosphaeria phaeospora]
MVWRVGPYMVKVGLHSWIFAEAENLIYLERNSDVRTPKVYAAFSSQDVNVFDIPEKTDKDQADRNPPVYYYLVEEYIEGETLEDVFEELKDRCHIYWKIGDLLGEQMQKLRSVPAEDRNHFGRVGGKAYPTGLTPVRHAPAPDFHDLGPFNSYEKFVERMMHSAKINQALAAISDDFPPATRMCFRDAPSVFIDHAGPSARVPVLSHLDIQDHNIIVKLLRDEKGKVIDVQEVVLIDWATLCWMPSWYEAGVFCRYECSRDELYQSVGSTVLTSMGHVNMGPTAFFAMCIQKGAFQT